MMICGWIGLTLFGGETGHYGVLGATMFFLVIFALAHVVFQSCPDLSFLGVGDGLSVVDSVVLGFEPKFFSFFFFF